MSSKPKLCKRKAKAIFDFAVRLGGKINAAKRYFNGKPSVCCCVALLLLRAKGEARKFTLYFTNGSLPLQWQPRSAADMSSMRGVGQYRCVELMGGFVCTLRLGYNTWYSNSIVWVRGRAAAQGRRELIVCCFSRTVFSERNLNVWWWRLDRLELSFPVYISRVFLHYKSAEKCKETGQKTTLK